MNRKERGAVRALYVRVSTEAQAEEGYSVGAQTERLQSYCRAMGWTETELYVDGGFSGSNLERPQMKRLIEDARSGSVAAVLVYKLDRLSRSQKDTLYLIEDVFLPNGVDFISLNESIDTSTPYGRAMIGILSAFAQLERENICMRTKMGMLERVKKGYWRGAGVPYGYDYDPEQGILIPNADAENVRRIYDLYIQGYSAQMIADMFGISSEKVVTHVITRRANTGVITNNGEVYAGRHQAIISDEVYELAMEKMRERSRKARATTTKCHLLTGLVYCGECGARMRYIKWGKAGYKLMCYSRDKGKPHMHKSDECRNPHVWAADVEKAVLDDLFRISVNMEADKLKDPAAKIDPAEALRTRIRLAEAKLKRLYNLYAGDEDDALLETIRENKAALASMKSELEREESIRSSTKKLERLGQEISSIRQAWPYLSELERQQIIRDCVEKIVVTGSRLEIYYTFDGNGRDFKVA